ncbi:MAG TPA: NAD(P)/FAD-dependent oxidoreductase [Ilumatobacter sp.]|jgi:cation diffusion facilitator CzcD-associated flavoprotein CzcO|nr:NAD(P)/FAD-dependent oxidoreductase [Ilumatobacter sp.]
MNPAGEQFDAVIIGAGFSGLYMLHRLRNLGLRCRVYETGDGVGGTWYWNRYPGARCDSESYFYCYSFSDEILQEWAWTERFPSQQEIRRYLEFVAERLDLWRDIQLGTRVSSATYDDEARRWCVETSTGDTVSARYVVTAIGAISAANVPSIRGLETFAGRWYHTGQWPHEGVDLSGLRVGVIGTGSTGVQLIPVVAEQAAELTVFQRTPNFSMPARNRPLDPAVMTEIKANYSDVWDRVRRHPGGMPLDLPTQRFDEVDEQEARRRYESAWAHGGVMVLQQFSDLMTDERSNEFCADFFRQKIRSIVNDPVTAEKLVPKGYPIAAKRPVLDTDYFETFNKPHVRLVDINDTPIDAITPTGVRAGGTVHELDVIVFATGFDAFTGSFLRIDITGRGGVRLADKWKDGPTAYLGLGIAGFPNLLTVNGPCNPAVLTNVPATIEHDVEWIADCIEYAEQRGIKAIEPTEEAEREWVRYTAELVDGTLYMKANSWWLGANIPGKPRVFMAFVGGLNRFRKRCAEIAEAGYEGFRLTT